MMLMFLYAAVEWNFLIVYVMKTSEAYMVW